LSISQYSYFGLGNPVKTLGNLFQLDYSSLEVVRASKRKKNGTTTKGLAQMKRLINWWLICGWVALTPTDLRLQTDPNLIIDPSYVKKIEQSGFITALYKK
jgi:hypothetical protein